MSTMEHLALYLTASTILADHQTLEIDIKKLIEKAEKLRIENEKKEIRQ
jgi:hypothetical protein